MKTIDQEMFDQAAEILANAKKRRNWGGIGEFSLSYDAWPEAKNKADYQTLCDEVQNAFLEKGEVQVIIQLFPRDTCLRVLVSRGADNKDEVAEC